MKNAFRSLVVLSVALLFQQSAGAALVTTFNTLYPAPAETDPIGGSVLISVTEPFASASFSGTLTSEVISGDTTNLLGGLTFTYRLFSNASSLHPINRLAINGYAGWIADASYNIPTAQKPPTFINRPVDSVIGFSFANVIGPGVVNPGETSALLVIQTNASFYTDTVASLINGYVTTVPSLSPVPEPATIGLVCMSALALLRQRRRCQ